MAPPRPTLALCVPAYNAAGHLHRLFTSVQQQSTPFDEVLVYDDASSDNTADIARALGATVIRTERNTGASIGKNALAAAATSDWIHFHDADDALGPRFVAEARALMEDTADVVLFGTQDRDDATGEAMADRFFDDAALRNDAVGYCIAQTVTNCGVYRRQAFLDVGGFDVDPETHYNEDKAMHLRLALAGLRFRASNYLGVLIYRRSGSMSSGHPIECARAQYVVLEKAVAATGSKYVAEIGPQLWRLCGALGGFRDWTYVRRCLALARKIGYVDPSLEHPVIRLAARVSPLGAIAGREVFIRALKPGLRRGMPIAQ